LWLLNWLDYLFLGSFGSSGYLFLGSFGSSGYLFLGSFGSSGYLFLGSLVAQTTFISDSFVESLKIN